MSFQEFASELFGGRKSAEKRAKDDMFGDDVGKAKGVFEDEQMLKENARESDEFSEDEVVSGAIPEWLAEKKLPRTTKDKSTVKGGDMEDKTAITGVKEHETDDAVLMNIKKQGRGGQSFAREKWIPKSEFDEFGSNEGLELSESKEEKAEKIMEGRSERAQRTDRRNAAPIADSFEEWKKSPSETDLPGVDTLGSGEDLDDIF